MVHLLLALLQLMTDGKNMLSLFLEYLLLRKKRALGEQTKHETTGWCPTYCSSGRWGSRQSKGSLVGDRLKFSWLNSVFPTFSDDASDLELISYTQSYILQLIGGVLFTDHSDGQVHCMYISLIAELDSCTKLSWGSVVLAFLYRELCKSCRKDKDENAGCLILLQLWTWTRLHTLAPVPRVPSLNNPEIWGDLPGPYDSRWCASLSFTDSDSHTLAHFRLSLDVLIDSHFT